MKTQELLGYGFLTAMLALLVWILFGKKASYLTNASGVEVGPLIQPDILTGAPQFDGRVAGSFPGGQSLAPIYPPGQESDPRTASCPIGFELWKNIQDGSYRCYQQGAPVE